MPSGFSLTSWGEGASLALVRHPSSNSIVTKIPFVVDVLLHQPASHIFLLRWLKLNLILLLDQLKPAYGDER